MNATRRRAVSAFFPRFGLLLMAAATAPAWAQTSACNWIQAPPVNGSPSYVPLSEKSARRA